VALVDALNSLQRSGLLVADPLVGFVAAVSVGMYRGTPVLDLDYAEDSQAGSDVNVVMTDAGQLIEVQGTAEAAPFSRDEFNRLLDLGTQGVAELIQAQKAALAEG
jgi:ribonuclease PH